MQQDNVPNDYINKVQQSNPRNGMIIEASVKEVNHFVDKVFKMNMLIFGLYYCLYYYVFWFTSVTNTTINT
jgi:type III secretory pathway component EscU